MQRLENRVALVTGGSKGIGFGVAMSLLEQRVKVAITSRYRQMADVATHFGSNLSSDEAWKIQPEDIGQLVVDLLRMNPRTLPSKIEVRPSMPPGK